MGLTVKSLTSCREFHVTSCESLSPLKPLPHVDVNTLSTAQEYLWQMCQAVSEGHCPCGLALSAQETLNHSQWLTCTTKTSASMMVLMHRTKTSTQKHQHPGPTLQHGLPSRRSHNVKIEPNISTGWGWEQGTSAPIKSYRLGDSSKRLFQSPRERAISHDHIYGISHKGSRTS